MNNNYTFSGKHDLFCPAFIFFMMTSCFSAAVRCGTVFCRWNFRACLIVKLRSLTRKHQTEKFA